MQKTNVNRLLESIEQICESAHKSDKFDETKLEAINEYVKEVANYLDCSPRQAFWFSILFTINLHRAEVDLDDIASFLNCSILSVFKYLNDFDELAKLRAIRKYKSENGRRKVPDRLDCIRFYIPAMIIHSLSKGELKIPKRQQSNSTIYDILDDYANLFQERNNELLTQQEFNEEIILLFGENQHLPFIKIIKGYKLSLTDLSLIMFICSEFIDFAEGDLLVFSKTYFTNSIHQMAMRKQFMNGTNKLQKLNLVTSPSNDFQSDKTIVLTEYAKGLFFGEDKDLFSLREHHKSNIILSSEIIPQKMFYNRKEQEQLNELADLLHPENFKVICGRLQDSGLRNGINILLHGPAGTGKSESCYQLAKQSGRDIFKVSIEQTKSKWFGESERLIAEIFDSYSRLVGSNDTVPILMLNECDGVLSTRISVQSSVSQTQNAMQNLLLERMESLNGGILIATTNLVQNLDKAFERRFLYKVELKKPSLETRCLIWRDKIPGLTDEDYYLLSKDYSLSGGQLENLARKSVVYEILYSTKLSLSQLRSLCEDEFLDKAMDRKKIGFLE